MFLGSLQLDEVEPEVQLALSRHTVALRGDESALAAAAQEVAARYLVQGGVGRLSAPHVERWGLGALDATLSLVSPLRVQAPVTHLYFARRPYGASVDILKIKKKEGAEAGVCSVALVFGAPAGPMEAGIVGSLAAELLLSDLLRLQPLPSSLHLRWVPGREPEVRRLPLSSSLPLRTPIEEVARGSEALVSRVEAAGLMPAIVADAEARYPNEACGLLLRRSDGTLRALATDNVQDRDHERDPIAHPRTARVAFRLDPLFIARAVFAGETLVAIYHSHCDAGAYLSSEDRRGATIGGVSLYPGVAWMVLSVMGGEAREFRSFVFDAAQARWRVEVV